jgi:hypothetical protein
VNCCQSGFYPNVPRIKELLVKAEWTLSDLARESAVPLNTVKKYRQSVRRSESDFFCRIRDAFEVKTGLKIEISELALNYPVDSSGLLVVPRLVWNARLPRSSLLRPDAQIVSYYDPHGNLTVLEKWALSSVPVSVQLIHGEGGVGKTRLAIEGCELLRSKSWKAGFCVFPIESFLVRLEELLLSPKPVCLVIDYAEYQIDEVVGLLRAILRAEQKLQHIRIVLLSRDVRYWYDQVCLENELIQRFGGTAVNRFRPKSPCLKDDDRQVLFKDSVRAFAKCLRRKMPRSLNGEIGGLSKVNVLALQIRALILFQSRNGTLGDDDIDLLLGRERRFWSRMLSQYQIPPSCLDLVAIAVAATTTVRGLPTRKDTVTLLRSISEMDSEPGAIVNSLSQLLSSIYPGEMYVEPLMPDLLGERLIENVFSTPELSDRLSSCLKAYCLQM